MLLTPLKKSNNSLLYPVFFCEIFIYYETLHGKYRLKNPLIRDFLVIIYNRNLEKSYLANLMLESNASAI